jgi:hypothetical protein
MYGLSSGAHTENTKLCPDCGQLIKKKCFATHSNSHVDRIVIGEEATIGMLDEIRRQKRLQKQFNCEEDGQHLHRMY